VPKTAAIASLCLLTLATSALASMPADASHALRSLNIRAAGPLVETASRALSVDAMQIAAIDAVAPDGHAFSTFVPIGPQVVTLSLTPYDVADPLHFKVVEYRKGQYVEVARPTSRTYRGTIDEIPGSVIAASLLDEGLFARILLPDGGEYWIEPLAARIAEAGISDHAIYSSDNVRGKSGTCGTIAEEVHGAVERFNVERGSGPCGANFCVAQVACDADVFFYQDWGNSTTAVVNRINTVFNAVNVVYERDVKIRHTITQIVVRTDGDEPYSTSEASTLLSQLANEWNNNLPSVPRDVVHMFTGRALDGSTIGIAYLGVICNNQQAYGLVESDCCGSLNCASDLSAHELGHNWNGPHCSCNQFTMNPSITCRNRFNTGSINTIVNFRDARGCLAPDILPPPPTAFNVISPANGSTIADTGPFFDWEASNGVGGYQLRYSTNPDLSNATSFILSVSYLDASNGTFADGQTIYWSVVATDQFGQQTTMTPAVASFTINTNPPPPGCPGDANADNFVNGADLSVLLGQFGTSVEPGTGGDFNEDGQVNGADLSVLLGLFGSGC